jgi:hypothetical protein
MKAKFSIIVFTVSMFVSAAFAQTATPVITEKQINQQARIHEGVKSGELTRKEKRHLEMAKQKFSTIRKLQRVME